MVREIVFARHGNTFAPGEKAVWVGRESDPPLVEKGLEQARCVAEALARRGFLPGAVYCGTLKRTRVFAQIVAEGLAGAPAPLADARLDEIHYGSWAGLTSEEIAARFDSRAALDAWNERDAWPAGAGWESTRDEIFNNIRSFIAERVATAGAPERLLVVSSNGILRFFPRLLGAREGASPLPRSCQMRTGHVGRVVAADGGLVIERWNVEPGLL